MGMLTIVEEDLNIYIFAPPNYVIERAFFEESVSCTS